MSEPLGRHAAVIGASMAGLLAARVLSDHFASVTILERDEVVDEAIARKGQPHARHLHALLAEGLRRLEHYFPDLRRDLSDGGAVIGDMGQDIRWYAFGGFRRQFPSGMTGALMSRPFLEQCIRRRVQALPNVTIRGGTQVDALVPDPGRARVTGLQLKARDGSAEVLATDLVVDTSGRGSATPKWLEALGYSRPAETAITIHMGYATRVFRRKPGDLDGAKLLMVLGTSPVERACNVIPVEGERWIATLTGWGGDYPPDDEAGFLEFARSLPCPDAHAMLTRLEPISDIVQHRLPANLRRHYERLPRFPERYLVMGDAVSSFNPAYAQGMTSAAMQAGARAEALRGSRDLTCLTRRVFPRLAAMVDRPWQLAAGEDFRFRATTGPKPFGTDLVNAYVERVHRATHTDTVVYGVFLDVMNLVRPPTSLMHPGIVWRVLRATA